MAVNLSVSSVFTPTTPFADALLGGGTGIDFGTAVNGQWAPIINKVANTGALDVYLSHDGINKITDFKTHIQEYGTATGFTYGGSDTAPNDFVTMRDQGNTSGSSKNNADGNSAGLWMEMDADVSAINFFDRASRPTLVKVYGESLTGIDLTTAFTIANDAMVYDSGGGTETVATSPVDGEVGASGDSVLGDRAHVYYRTMFPGSFTVGGTIQFEIVYTYSFTS